MDLEELEESFTHEQIKETDNFSEEEKIGSNNSLHTSLLMVEENNIKQDVDIRSIKQLKNPFSSFSFSHTQQNVLLDDLV